MSDAFGFFISELRIKGPGLSDVSVKFGTGLSVVAGPSNTGKSFVREAINFVFGSATPLKTLTEQGKYDILLVEITDYTGKTLTLERAWRGGDVTIYEEASGAITADTPKHVVSWQHDPHSTDTVSNVLLGLCGLEDTMVRTNARGKTRLVSFRDLKDYGLVSEARIISETSPIHSGQYTQRTVETSIFRALLTGLDDRSIATMPDRGAVRVESKVQKELFEQLRLDIQQRIGQSGRTELELLSLASEIDALIEEQSKILSSITADTVTLERQQREVWSEKKRLQARLDEINSMISRFGLLSSKYDSDLDRLMSNIEASILLGGTVELDCPLCGSSPEYHSHATSPSHSELENYTIACDTEVTKISRLRVDLAETVSKLSDESRQLAEQISFLDSRLSDIGNSLRTIVEPNIANLRNGLSELVQSRRETERSLTIYDELRRLEHAEGTLVVTAPTIDASKQDFVSISSIDYEEFAKEVENVLDLWSYPELDRVIFDAKVEDLVISGKPRTDNGKGYRAITYAAFMVALLRMSRRKGLPHPGFVILDSPLVTYREPMEEIGEGLKAAFYRELAELGSDAQVIVLENEEPPVEIQDLISLTTFTKNKTTGRYGLLPVD